MRKVKFQKILKLKSENGNEFQRTTIGKVYVKQNKNSKKTTIFLIGLDLFVAIDRRAEKGHFQNKQNTLTDSKEMMIIISLESVSVFCLF